MCKHESKPLAMSIAGNIEKMKAAGKKLTAADIYDDVTAFELALRDLLCDRKEVFYGQLLSQFRRVHITNGYTGKWRGVDTCAVALEKNQVVLIINDDFFEEECSCDNPSFRDYPNDLPDEMRGMRFCQNCAFLEVRLTPKNRMAILKHECQHIAHRHLTRRDAGDYEPQKANIAMDAVINQWNPEVPKGCVDYRQIEGAIPDDKWENYYTLLEKEQEKKQGQGQCGTCGGTGQAGGDDEGDGESGQCPDCDGMSKWGQVIDNHSFFGQGDEDTNMDIADELLKDQIKKASESVGIGNTPHEIRQEIASFSEEAKINWRKVLRNWMQESVNRDRRLDARRESMSVPGVFPGQMYVKTPEFDVYVDASGSIGMHEFQQFMAEVLDINAKLKATVNLHQWDTDVHHTQVIENQVPDLVRAACGGTDCQCVLDHAWENKVRNLIIMTDGYFHPVDTTGLNVLWVYTPHHSDQGGKGVVLDDLEE